MNEDLWGAKLTEICSDTEVVYQVNYLMRLAVDNQKQIWEAHSYRDLDSYHRGELLGRTLECFYEGDGNMTINEWLHKNPASNIKTLCDMILMGKIEFP